MFQSTIKNVLNTISRRELQELAPTTIINKKFNLNRVPSTTSRQQLMHQRDNYRIPHIASKNYSLSSDVARRCYDKKKLLMKKHLNWRVKGLIQLLLSKIPFGVNINHKLQFLRGAYTEKGLLKSALIQSDQIREFDHRQSIENSTVLEIGTGWSLIGVILFHLKGAKKIFGVDLHPHANHKVAHILLRGLLSDINGIATCLGVSKAETEHKIKLLLKCNANKSLFECLNFTYIAPGDARHTNLKDSSVDIVFSYGVLEHIPTDVLAEVFDENNRILKNNGTSYHNIGMHDHYDSAGLGNGVNFLKYPQWYWQLMTGNDISYHNRLRLSDYRRMFKNSSLLISNEKISVPQKNIDALKQIKLNQQFHGYSKTDLAAAEYFVDLKVANTI